MLTLYSKETTSFSTLGIGVLRDFISHPLITEELNGAYTLEFEYAKDGYLSEYLIEQNIIKADGQAFRIWNIKKDMQKITVFAKHIFFDLSFNFLADVFPTNLTAQSALEWMLNRAAVATNFSATGNCTQTASTRYVRKNFIDAVFNEDNALLKKFGGELSYDNFNITVHDHRGTNANFSIRYKKNLTGIDFNLDFSNVATRIVPIGFDGLTIDSTYVESPRASNYFTPLYKTYEFNDIKYDPDDEEAYHTLAEAKQALINAANELFTKNVDLPQVSIGVNFVELSKCSEYASYSNLERVHLGDTIDVIIPELNIHTSARVNKTVYDCILDRFITLEIGSAKQSITRTQIVIENQIRKSENYLTQAQQNAENLINHPFNGNVYIDKENGVIYLMDSTSPETAQNVWKWSLGGLGFSSTGINGTYTVAILQDGRINADFITTGQLDTGVIQGYDSLLIQVDTLDREFQKEINPTGVVSDSSITLEDSAETELIDFELEGKTTQETRSGYNLLLSINSGSSNSTVSNGNITFDFSVNQDTYRFVTFKKEVGKTYTLSFDGSGLASGENIKFTLEGGGTTYFQFKNGKNAWVITTSRDNNQFTIDDVNRDNITSTITLSNIMILEGSYTEQTLPAYEKYGLMPSPDYPSELVSVGYENLLNLVDGTYTHYGITGTVSNGIITLNGTATSTAFVYINVSPSLNIPLNETISLSANNPIANNNVRLRIDNDGYLDTILDSTNKTSTINVNRALLGNKFGVRVQSGTTLSNFVIKPQIEKGTQAHSYIPYGKYGIEVKTNGKNLFDESQLLNATNWVKNDSGYYQGGASELYFKYGQDKNGFDFPNVFKENTQYTLSFEVYTGLGTGNARFQIHYTDGTLVNMPNWNYTTSTKLVQTTVANKTISKITFGYGSNPGAIFIKNIQLEECTHATTYEEYNSNTYLYILDNPLRSIGDTKDLLYIKNGMLYVDRKIGSIVLNGSEEWENQWNTSTVKGYRVSISDIVISTNLSTKLGLFSNYYAEYTQNDLASGITHYGICGRLNNSQIIIRNDDMTSTNGFKSWLSTHNTEVQYILAEPYTEELGQVDMPSTYKGITYLNTTDELEPNMDITYVRDTLIANYVESHVNEIKITEKGIESRVQSIEAGDYGTRINAVEERTTDTEHSIDIISTNIDTTTGEVRRVTTTTGFTFNEEGMSIEDSSSNFKALHRNTGTTYYDGNTIVGQYTKDGSKQKDLDLFGIYTYGKNDIDDTPMFIAQLYTDANGEECFGHFYNRGD